MSQVKISLTEEEKARLEQEAADCKMPLSKYLKKRLDENSVLKPFELQLPDEINYEDLSKISVRIPKEVLLAIDKKARILGISRTDYITTLLIQSGNPVILEYHAEYKSALSKQFFDTIMDIRAIRDTAMRSGTVYPSELNTITQEFSEAAKELRFVMRRLDRKTNELVEQINRDLNHMGKKNIKSLEQVKAADLAQRKSDHKEGGDANGNHEDYTNS